MYMFDDAYNYIVLTPPGLSQRIRTVTRRALNGGRKCPSLTQNRSCQDYECADFMWDIGEVSLTYFTYLCSCYNYKPFFIF